MATDFVYENAPLVEVIAEVHWELKSVASAPDAQIDPFFDLFRDAFIEDCKNDGLTEVERLVPQEIPVEFVPRQPHLRLRQREPQWPLVQIGPGIVTMNIVPPYKGWKEFFVFLEKQVARIFTTYPLAAKALNINRLHLRYIDAFGPDHGYSNYSEFSQKMLGFPRMISEKFEKTTIEEKSSSNFILENRYKLAMPKGAAGRTKLLPAKVHGRDAAVLELHCDQNFSDKEVKDAGQLLAWFNQAHDTLSIQFDMIATDQLKSHFGAKREIG